MGGFTDTLQAKATFDEQFEAACRSQQKGVATDLGRSASYIFKSWTEKCAPCTIDRGFISTQKQGKRLMELQEIPQVREGSVRF